MSKLDEQADLYHSALRSGQQWGIASLYAQKRMGEITQDMPATKNKYNVSLPLQNGRVGPCTGGALEDGSHGAPSKIGRPLHRRGIGVAGYPMVNLPRLPRTGMGDRDEPAFNNAGSNKMKHLKESGISKTTYQQAEQLAKHPEILDRVVENAKKGFKISGINTLFIK